MDPNISKARTGKERVVATCAESQSRSRGPNRTRFLTVQTAIRTKMECDKETLLAEADASKKRNLMLVGGHGDNALDLCGEGNADVKHPSLEESWRYPHVRWMSIYNQESRNQCDSWCRRKAKWKVRVIR
jgi:hypothetical protein